MNVNPLSQYTRHEKICIKLPTNGHFYEDGVVDFNTTHEVGIQAMTANDEITAKTPDSLLNGDALVKMIENCVPNVHDARKLALPDSEALLIAIRVASYGPLMEVTSNCPECSHENTYDADLQQCLDNVAFLEKEYLVQLPDSKLQFSISPYTLNDQIQNSLSRFKEQQLMNDMINNDDDSTEEEKALLFTSAVQEIANIAFNLVSGCVREIRNPDGNVIDLTPEELNDGIKDLTIQDSKIVIDKVTEINDIGIDKMVQATCSECEHTWSTRLNYNPSDFFEIGSYS